MKDRQGRNIEYLRVSVTDRCNLRCLYCMPETGAGAAAQGELLTFDEIRRVVSAMARLGVHGLRLTGGEPMARPGCLELVGQLKRVPGIRRVAMTTNGILLRGRVAEAAEAGLDALNLSIDALNPDLYRQMTRGGDLSEVLATLDEALALALEVRLNAVIVRGLNEGEPEALAVLAERLPVDVRFIELMPVGCGRGFMPVRARRGFGPAVYYRPAGFAGCIGFISAVSHSFCDRCNRVRLTPEGWLKLCLNRSAGLDLRALLRGGCDDDALTEALRRAILEKPLGHGFGEAIPDRECRGMHQFGG